MGRSRCNSIVVYSFENTNLKNFNSICPFKQSKLNIYRGNLFHLIYLHLSTSKVTEITPCSSFIQDTFGLSIPFVVPDSTEHEEVHKLDVFWLKYETRLHLSPSSMTVVCFKKRPCISSLALSITAILPCY